MLRLTNFNPETIMHPADSKSNVKEPARILVMDDEDHIRIISKKMLEKFGYMVELSHDGEDAVSRYQTLLQNNTPARLVIMDLTVPGGMGGKEAAKRILDLDPAANIVISSGASDDPTMAQYTAMGIKGFIPKPYRLEELKTTVKRLLGEDR